LKFGPTTGRNAHIAVIHRGQGMGQIDSIAPWLAVASFGRVAPDYPYVDLVAAYGWLSRGAEAKPAIAGLHKLMPGFTEQDWAKIKFSDDPRFQREYARIVEGLRKAGLPEGEKPTN
jgi:hypothetical protein